MGAQIPRGRRAYELQASPFPSVCDDILPEVYLLIYATLGITTGGRAGWCEQLQAPAGQQV